MMSLLLIQILCMVGCISTAVRNHYLEGQGTAAIITNFISSFVTYIFLMTMAEKLSLLVNIGKLRASFRIPYYSLVTLFWLPCYPIWSICFAFVRYTSIKVPIGNICTTLNVPGTVIFFVFFIILESVMNLKLVKTMYDIACLDTESNHKIPLTDIKNAFMPLSKKVETEEQEKRFRYLKSLRFGVICILMDIFFLVIYVMGSFIPIKDAVQKANFTLAMSSIATCGIFIHMMTACTFLQLLAEM